MFDWARSALPVAAVLLALVAAWYPAAMWMNHDMAASLAEEGASAGDVWFATLSLDRPLLPAPHQVAGEILDELFGYPVSSPRSLVFHAGVTAGAALCGFAVAVVLGTALAVGIVHARTLDRSLMPWVIASQTVPVLAIAPMVIVVLGHAGLTGLWPKALIAGWLSFFPVTAAMVTGLRAPDPMQRDLMRTYAASGVQVFARLRWPASMAFLFPALKVAGALALVGAVVAELPTGAQAGLGARLLAGSYYGQTLQIWAALFTAGGAGDAGDRRRRAGPSRPGARTGRAAVTTLLLLGVLAGGGALLWRLARGRGAVARVGPPVLFGLLLLAAWQIACVGYGVPGVLLPPPSAIAWAFATHLPTLGADWVQTVLRAVLPGCAAGCAAGLCAAVALDRSDFLRRGVMPLGSLAAAMPIVGIAPIMVMWFGFDWPSKAAVVAVMTSFPTLVQTTAGLAAAGVTERDLMRGYGAGYFATLLRLRLPAAVPFLFVALKLNATLALIGAIVAEFFGTPIVGMGFRISTEATRMNLDLVWAEIVLASLTGTLAFAVLLLLERRVAFWHPSFR